MFSTSIYSTSGAFQGKLPFPDSSMKILICISFCGCFGISVIARKSLTPVGYNDHDNLYCGPHHRPHDPHYYPHDHNHSPHGAHPPPRDHHDVHTGTARPLDRKPSECHQLQYSSTQSREVYNYNNEQDDNSVMTFKANNYHGLGMIHFVKFPVSFRHSL